MIQSFAARDTAAVFQGLAVRKLPRNIQVAARRKLIQIDQSTNIDQLRIPPGNRLEKLKGNRADCWSIRINEQWRICFRWEGEHAFDVEIIDYH